MKKKFILSVLIYITIFYLAVSTYSCQKDDNTVKQVEPPPPPVSQDTADRYIWKTYMGLLYVPSFLYAADTNKVYIVSDGKLILFDGNSFSMYINESNFDIDNVYGFDQNNIFIIGKLFQGNNTYYPMLKKITNGSSQNYQLSTDRGSVFDILVTGPNQAWISEGYGGKVYYFDNGNILKYKIIDIDSLSGGFFYKSQDNSIYVFSETMNSNYNRGTLFTHKFNGSFFDLLRKDSIGTYPNNSYTMFRAGKDIIMTPLNSDKSGTVNIKYFNDNEWVFHSCRNDSIMNIPRKLGGISKDSLVMLDYSTNGYTYGYKKWRRERNFAHIEYPNYVFISNIEIVKNYCFITYDVPPVNFIVGRLK